MNDKLTLDRIHAAIPEVTRLRDAIYHRESSMHLDTAIAALDLAERFRWRDPKMELPPLEKVFIAVDENGEVCLGEMYTRVYWNSDDSLVYPNPRIKFSYAGARYEANCDFHTLKAFMPLPEWKGEE